MKELEGVEDTGAGGGGYRAGGDPHDIKMTLLPVLLLVLMTPMVIVMVQELSTHTALILPVLWSSK